MLLIIKEMQLKNTISYYLTSITMATTKKIYMTNSKEGVEKGKSLTLLMGGKLVQPLWKTVWRLPEKVKIELPYDLARPPLGKQPKKMITLILKSSQNHYLQKPRYERNLSADHGPLPARLLCPWAYPGKNTGVSCHSLLQEIFKTGDQT